MNPTSMMYPNSRFFGLLLAVSSFFLLSLYIPMPDQEVSGLYVDNFRQIIGQPEKEDALLAFAQAEGFNYLLLYNLYAINRHLYRLDDPVESKALARFIQKAKTTYGIQKVGAVGETAKSFNVIHAYNQLYKDNDFCGIDVYNIEFEFWNKKLVADYYCPSYLESQGDACGADAIFDYYLEQLRQIRDMAHKVNIECETYIGKPTQAQCKAIGEVCDRVLVHYYRASDQYKNGNSIYQYNDYRLPALAPDEGALKVMPIFSARENHMGPWLKEHRKEEAFQTYYGGRQGYEESEGEWKEHIKLEGAQWYRYSDLAKLKP